MRKTLIISALLLVSALGFAGPAASVSLDGKWTLDYWEQAKKAVMGPEDMQGVQFNTVSATVPGNVELDLLAAGLVEDPELGSNSYKLRKYEGYQWRYSTTFTTPAHDALDDIVLNFGGIDCFAEVWVNGKHAGSCDNMLIAQKFDVTDLVGPAGASNTLEVYIRSSVIEGRKGILGPISINFAQPESTDVRRAPHTYGWDIMPRIVSAGLWKSVSVEVFRPAHIRDVNWITLNVDEKANTARMIVDYNIALPVALQDGKLVSDLRLTYQGKEVYSASAKVCSNARRFHINLQDVHLWWPRGYGDAALYDAEMTLKDAATGEIIDRDVKKIGIRTIRLDFTEVNTEEKPGRFCFIVNNTPVYARGSNWTPLDAFHSRDLQWTEKTFDLVLDLNCNMLRCWGGNVYESDEFYGLCDANGIMIWQDFAMGCNFYSQLHAFQLAVEKEIYDVVLRLRNHPCIALWAGNNEDDQALAIGTLSPFRPDPNKDVVSRETIPHVLFELDPSRTYLPSSPYFGQEKCKDYYTDGSVLPEDHIWGPRDYYKSPFYLGVKCLFISEIGYHGMPNRESLEKMFPAESVYPWTNRTDFHWNEDYLSKAVRIFEEWGYTPERNNLMINQVRNLFGEVPSDLDSFIFGSQIVQAEAMKYFIERSRGTKFTPSTGMLWWNIRDGWPLLSDAVTDFYFSKKLAYYFIKNVQRNVCVVILDAKDGFNPLIATNDTMEPASGSVKVEDVQTGKVLFNGNYQVPANSAQQIASIKEMPGQGMLRITYTGQDGARLGNHYLYGKAPYSMKQYREWLSKVDIEGVKIK